MNPCNTAPVAAPVAAYSLQGHTHTACPECGLVIGSAEFEKLSRKKRRPRLWLTGICVLLIMELPYCWVLFDDWPLSDYRMTWVKTWLGLPALLGIWVMRRLGLDPSFQWEVVTMHAITAVAFVLLVWIASRGWIRFAIVLAGLLLYSLWNAMASYAIFRM
ncbi:MAG: hypothetical protein ACR2GY_07770 [Phycisphaerales bacterium]